MKSILFIALLAFAAQASLLDTESYTLGFETQLGIGYVPTSDGLQCFSSLNNTIASVLEIVQQLQSNVEDAVTSSLSLIATVDGPLKEDCEQYASDLLSYVASATNSTSEDELEDKLEDVVKANAQKYAAQLIQQVTAWVDAIASGDEYSAGSTEAYIIQILVGAETPEAISYPEIDWEEYVPVNYTTFIPEYYGAIYSALGLDGEESANAYAQCYNNISVAAPLIEDIVQNVQQADGLAKVAVIRSAVDDLSFVIEACVPAAADGLAVYAPVYQAIKQAPADTILTILHNIASNLPQLEQSQINASVDTIYGEYAQAGEILAGEILTIFQNAGY